MCISRKPQSGRITQSPSCCSSMASISRWSSSNNVSPSIHCPSSSWRNPSATSALSCSRDLSNRNASVALQRPVQHVKAVDIKFRRFGGKPRVELIVQMPDPGGVQLVVQSVQETRIPLMHGQRIGPHVALGGEQVTYAFFPIELNRGLAADRFVRGRQRLAVGLTPHDPKVPGVSSKGLMGVASNANL